MSQTPQMTSARRRPVPGMAATLSAPPPPDPTTDADRTETKPPEAGMRPVPPGSSSESETAVEIAPAAGELRRAGVARRAADYATTRLVNFRVPVDLHDRYRQLVRDVEERHPRLRHPSLTELVIALLEEGPQTADEVAALIRRKRAAEHADEASA
jgi:hypothetical protein